MAIHWPDWKEAMQALWSLYMTVVALQDITPKTEGFMFSQNEALKSGWKRFLGACLDGDRTKEEQDATAARE